MGNYRLERLSDQNLKDLLFLYKHAFNENESIDFLKKKYNTVYTGIQYVGFIAYHAQTNEIAAYYGVFPQRLEINGTVLIAAQSGDTMTHPAHRGKGLFIKLAIETYELAKELGIHFIYGFPNENSYPGFVKKLNWKHYSNVNHYKFKASSIPMDKLAKKMSFVKPLHNMFLPTQSISSELQFSNSLEHQDPSYGTVLHDKDFFNYKTYYPSFIKEIEGVKCWLKADGRLWVGDVEFCDENKFKSVVKHLIDFSKKHFCSSVVFSVQENSEYDRRLKKLTEPFAKIAAGCLDLSGKFAPEKFAYQAVDLDTY